MFLVTALRYPVRWLAALWRALTSFLGMLLEAVGIGRDVDPHTRVTFRALVDAVVPETPELEDELGPEHVPGGLLIDLDDFVITYVDSGFQFGLPDLGPMGNFPMADPVAHVLDIAALTLLDRGENRDEPDPDRAVSLLDPDDPSPEEIEGAIGTFAELSRRDRLHAISILDEFEVEVSPTDDDLFELDGGLVSQLVVGFVAIIYYSEWQGYDDFSAPPSERAHPNDPSAVQSWRQTGFPGFAPGYAALRGYLGSDEGPLGEGGVWATVDEDADVRIRLDSGSFRDNDYDTAGYDEPFPVEGE